MSKKQDLKDCHVFWRNGSLPMKPQPMKTLHAQGDMKQLALCRQKEMLKTKNYLTGLNCKMVSN